MLLSKLPILDKGHVALISCSLSKKNAFSLEIEENLDVDFHKKMRRCSHFTFLVKAPISILLYLANFDVRITQLKTRSEVETYAPSPSDVSTGDLSLDEAISDDIIRTSEALTINPKAYMQDGCAAEIAASILPVSTYVTCIISGYYPSFLEICEHSKQNNKLLIKGLISKIEDVLNSEWQNE
jgi:hypothetical protein